MTSESLTESIISLAQSHGIDPRGALSASKAALSLHNEVTQSDTVIWPVDQGGLAWEAVDKGGRTRGANGVGRIFCVTYDGFTVTPELWKRVDEEVSTQGRKVRRILLVLRHGTAVESGKRRPAFITGILERFFPPAGGQSGVFFRDDDTGVVTCHHVPPQPKTDIEPRRFQWDPPFSYGSWKGTKPVFLDRNLEIHERFLAARCVAEANLVPIIEISGNETSYAAHLADESAISRMIILSANHSSGAASLQSVISGPILTPANEKDITGALNWALNYQGSVLIVHPGSAALPPRTVLKSEWQTGTGIIVRDNINGSAGKVLFIVAGYMAKESVKAADRLIKKGFSVTVYSMRFIRPVKIGAVSAMASEYDLVMIVDTSGEGKGLGWTAGLPLIENSSINAAIAATESDGRSLAELTTKIYRENRFRRAVDDVKQDRW